MKRSDTLFQLIKSMSLAEKRYFKLYAGLMPRKNKRYVQLFDFLAKQQRYDEAAVKSWMRDYTRSKQLHVLKDYLFRLILKSLRSCDTGSRANSQLLDQLLDIEILVSRNVVDDCGLRLQQAKTMAEQFGKYTILMLLLQWERGIRKDMGEEQLDAINCQTLTVLETMKLLEQLRSIRYKIFFWQSAGVLPAKTDELAQFDAYVRSLEPLIKDRDANSYLALRLSDVAAYIASFRNDPVLAASLHAKQTAVLHHHPSYISEAHNRGALWYNQYIDALESSFKTNPEYLRRETIDQLIKEIKNEKTIDVASRRQHNLSALYIELTWCTYMGHYADGVKAVNTALSAMDYYPPNDHKRLLLELALYQAKFYHGLGCFDEASKLLNATLGSKDLKLYADLSLYVRILNLIVQYDANNLELLSYLLRSTKRYFKNKEVNSGYADYILKAVDTLRHWRHNTDLETRFCKLRMDVEPIQAAEPARNIIMSVDMHAWLSAKLEGISLSELLYRSRAIPTRSIA